VIGEATPMELEEFIAWARGKPFLPGTKPEDNQRLGWDPTFEQCFRWCVTQALRPKARQTVGLDDSERRSTLKVWLEVCFKILMSEPKIRNIHIELGKLSPEAQKAVTRVDKVRTGPEQQRSMAPLTPALMKARLEKWDGQKNGTSRR
jgi:hypothetical protein